MDSAWKKRKRQKIRADDIIYRSKCIISLFEISLRQTNQIINPNGKTKIHFLIHIIPKVQVMIQVLVMNAFLETSNLSLLVAFIFLYNLQTICKTINIHEEIPSQKMYNHTWKSARVPRTHFVYTVFKQVIILNSHSVVARQFEDKDNTLTIIFHKTLYLIRHVPYVFIAHLFHE